MLATTAIVRVAAASSNVVPNAVSANPSAAAANAVSSPSPAPVGGTTATAAPSPLLGAPTPEPIVIGPLSDVLEVGKTVSRSIVAPYDSGFGIVRDGCAGIAVPVVLQGSLKLSGLAPGTCSVTLAGAHGVTASLPVLVRSASDPIALAVAKSAVRVTPSHAILARGTAVTVRLGQGTYTGPFSIGGNCKGIASFVGLGPTVVVSAVDPGTCHAIFAGLGGRRGRLAIAVEPSPEFKP